MLKKLISRSSKLLCAEPMLLAPIKRSLALDALRGVAILMVMIMHFGEAKLFPMFPQPYVMVPALGMFGVDLFYVLSGFFITRAILVPLNWDPYRFFRARVTRIYPAFLVALALFILVQIFSSEINQKYVAAVLLHVLMLHNLFPGASTMVNGPFWTLGVEFPYYLFMLAVGPFLKDEKYFWRISIGMVLLSIVWRFAVFNFQVSEFSRFFAATQLPGVLDSFAMGGISAAITLDQRLNRLVERFKWPLFAIGLFFSFLSLWYVSRHVGQYWVYPRTAIFWRTGLAISFAIVVVACYNMRDASALRFTLLPWFGKISFSLYIYHYLPITMVNLYLTDYFWFAKLCVALAVGLAVSWLSWKLVETRFHRPGQSN